MNNIFGENKKVIAAIAGCVLIGGITMSFQNTPFGPIDKLDTMTGVQDTIPEKPKENDSKMSIEDFDQLLQNMDNKTLEMQAEISKINLDNIHSEITASLNKVDLDKIKLNIDRAMRDIDFSKIEHGVKTALKEIEWNKLNNDVKLSLQDAKKEIEKINMEVIKKEMEKAKLEIERSKKEIKKINIDELMRNVNAGIAKAKAELSLTKEMFNEMEKDGLINKKEGFTIDYKDKTLFINGKKQPEVVKEKYRAYMKGDTFRISISKQ